MSEESKEKVDPTYELSLKETSVKIAGLSNYGELMVQCLNIPTDRGFSITRIKKLSAIIDKVETAIKNSQETVLLTKEDLREILAGELKLDRESLWPISHMAIADFSEHVRELGKQVFPDMYK